MDGRVRGVHLPAEARVSTPLGWRRGGAEGPEEQAELQELQMVHDGGGVGSSQTLSAGGASSRRLGRGAL